MSENEAILKLMVPYGNRANTNGTYSYPIPYLYSEGKYAIKTFGYWYTIEVSYLGTNASDPYMSNTVNYFDLQNIDKITLINNLYVKAYYGSNTVALLNQNANHLGYTSRGNGYAVSYQDNFNDKLEVRCYNTSIQNGSRAHNKVHSSYTSPIIYYSKYGNSAPRYVHTCHTSRNPGRVEDLVANNVNTTCSKSAASQHNGFLPIFSI